MIAHFGSQLSGGANIAGMRLHSALRRMGHNSRFYYGAGDPPDESHFPLFQNRSFLWRNLAAIEVSWRNRQTADGGFVMHPKWIRKTAAPVVGCTPSVINLHWVSRWLDLPSFFNSLPASLPVVWTLHDLIPITGGCHYPAECTGFKNECGNCPQLRKPGKRDLTRRIFGIKRDWYRCINMHWVGNSEWTTAQAKASALAEHVKSIETIPYGLDTNEFAPVEKSVARRALGIGDGKLVIGFCCMDLSERRKGAELLKEALKELPRNKVRLLVMGAGKWPESGVETICLGGIGLARLQCVFYSALDLFVTPSLLETFGNTAMEAMACETPVVAYDTSGLRDVVSHGETGLLGKDVGSVTGLVEMMRWMLDHSAERMEMGRAGRNRVLKCFSDKLMAERYGNLYQRLTKDALK